MLCLITVIVTNTNLGPPIITAVPTCGLLYWIFIWCHTVVIWLVIVLALTVMATVYSLKDELHILWREITRSKDWRSNKPCHLSGAVKIKQLWNNFNFHLLNPKIRTSPLLPQTIFSLLLRRHQAKNKAVMLFAIAYRMHRFSLLKPQFTVCVCLDFCINITTHSPHSNCGL